MWQRGRVVALYGVFQATSLTPMVSSDMFCILFCTNPTYRGTQTRRIAVILTPWVNVLTLGLGILHVWVEK
jgi:hypothetical protein